MSVSTAEQLAKTLSYIGECVQFTESMRAQPNCNSCGIERCEYGPRLGRPIRINCPLWEEAEEEEEKEWKNGKMQTFHRQRRCCFTWEIA